MVDFERLKNSSVEFNQTNRHNTLVRADQLDGVSARHNLLKEGPQGPSSGRAIFNLAPGAKRVVFDNVRFQGSGFDTLVSGADAEYLVVHGCSMETGGPPPAQPHRYTFPSPSVPSREQQRQSGKLIGRNEQCPCRSGKKYKHCHGNIT
jgi:hypothetical protein